MIVQLAAILASVSALFSQKYVVTVGDSDPTFGFVDGGIGSIDTKFFDFVSGGSALVLRVSSKTSDWDFAISMSSGNEGKFFWTVLQVETGVNSTEGNGGTRQYKAVDSVFDATGPGGIPQWKWGSGSTKVWDGADDATNRDLQIFK